MKRTSFVKDSFEINIYEFSLLESRMYIILKDKKALVIDPFYDDEVGAILKGTEELTIILTHEHFDHISGVNEFRKICPCMVYASKACDDEIHGKRNSTSMFPMLFINDKEKYHQVRNDYKFPYVCDIDVCFEGEKTFEWCNNTVKLFETKGHSPGSISALINDTYLFSGDVLLGNGKELDSIRSDKKEYGISLEKYKSLCTEKVIVFPGHGDYDILQKKLDEIMR